MYLHMLDIDEQELFLSLAILLKVSDDDILWEGKTLDELTPATDMTQTSFDTSASEEAVIKGYIRELDKLDEKSESFNESAYVLRGDAITYAEQRSVYKAFIEELAQYPVHKQNDEATRISALENIFNKYFDKSLNDIKENSSSAVAKVFVYELQIMAMSNDDLSASEKMIIDRVAQALEVDEVTQEDLLTCAKDTTKQVAKTLALILE